MIIKVPLRLDIAGSYTDLPGYREKGGTHINAPLDYGVRIVSTPTTEAVLWSTPTRQDRGGLRSRRDGEATKGAPLNAVVHKDDGWVRCVRSTTPSTADIFSLSPPIASQTPQSPPKEGQDEFIEKMNFQVAQILNVPRVELMSTCDIEHGSGLGASSATVVGIVQYYSEVYHLQLKPEELALFACKAIEQTGICGRQDEFSAAFGCPVYLRYNKNCVSHEEITIVDTFELPPEFRRNMETWKLLYRPRTISCQEMLDHEMKANFNIEPIVQGTILMYNAIVNADWSNFYQAYKAHWLFVEGQNPSKINADIREIRRRYEGIYIRPCGAGAGGYLLIHGDVQGENIIDLKLKEN